VRPGIVPEVNDQRPHAPELGRSAAQYTNTQDVKASTQRTLRRLVSCLIAGLSLGLIAVLAAAAVTLSGENAPEFVRRVAFLFLHGAGLAWPIAATLGVAVAALGVWLLVRPTARHRSPAVALVLAVVALCTAWMMGVRAPGTRSGVFAGRYVHHPLCCKSDLFIPNEDPNSPLPIGADLTNIYEGPDSLPRMAAVWVPKTGWHGSHPEEWPAGYSDSPGAQYFCVRLRGTPYWTWAV